MKNIFLISSGFPPNTNVGGVIRMQKLVKYLSREDYRLEVFTSTQGFISDGPQKLYSRKLDDGYVVHRVYDCDVRRIKPAVTTFTKFLLGFFGGKSERINGGLSVAGKTASERLGNATSGVGLRLGDNLLPDQFFLWGLLVLFLALYRLIKVRPDLVFATAPSYTNLVVGAALSYICNRKLVIDLRDPWSTNPFSQDGRFAALKFFDKALERLVFRRAAKIVVVNKNFIDPIVQIHGESLRCKMVVIPNGYDPQDFELTPRTFGEKGVNFVHAGRFYPGRTPLEPLRLLQRSFAVLGEKSLPSIHLVGSGEEYKDDLETLEMGDIVQCTGFLPHAETLRYMLGADFLILIPGVGKSTLTGKIFEYFASGRPIILFGSHDSAAAELIEEHMAGLVIDPTHLHAHVELAEFITRVKDGGWAGPCDVQAYSRVEIALKFARVFAEATHECY